MPLREFVSCWYRIDRAESHAAAFGKAWNDFLEENPYRASLRMAEDGTGSLWVVSRQDELPPVLSLEIGETLYNLRAALDGAIYAAVIRETRSDPPPNARHLGFPVCSSADRFRQVERKVAPLKDPRRQIIESIQPYNIPSDLTPDLLVFNFNRTLDILNKWARKDRHRALHVVGAWSSSAMPMILIPAPAYLESFVVTGDGFINGEREVATFGIRDYDSGMNIRANPNLIIDAAVQEDPGPIAGNDTLSNRIRAMIVMTKTVVGRLESSLL
jgi:hypothetical protein